MNFISDLWVGGKTANPPLSHLDYRQLGPTTTAPKGLKRRWTKLKNTGRGSRCDLPGQTYLPFVIDGVKQRFNLLVTE